MVRQSEALRRISGLIKSLGLLYFFVFAVFKMFSDDCKDFY